MIPRLPPGALAHSVSWVIRCTDHFESLRHLLGLQYGFSSADHPFPLVRIRSDFRLIQPSPPVRPVRHTCIEQSPECRAMMRNTHMTELMHEQVVNAG